MICFYPGPSQLYPNVPVYMQEAYREGVLSLNHRSKRFTGIFQEAVELLKAKLNIPSSYHVFFCTSATECWEIISQAFIDRYSFHICKGSFAERWLHYRKLIAPNASGTHIHLQRDIGFNKLLDSEIVGMLCLVHTETSNATQISDKKITKLKRKYKNALVAIDATSSMGGLDLPWENGDIWFASVQKCFGLPAGLGIIVCSPSALEDAAHAQKRVSHYNSLYHIYQNALKYQSTHTPNILGIYLLMRLMRDFEGIEKVDKRTRKRAEDWYHFLIQEKYKLLIQNQHIRSKTVLAVSFAKDRLEALKLDAQKHDFMLGNGYGTWKDSTFRIANFPVLQDEHIESLKDYLRKYPH